MGQYGGNSASCTLNNPCGNDLAPYILEIPNQTISYKDNFKIDLWNYVKDYDDFPSELEISAFYTFHGVDDSVVCELVSNRYLKCSALNPGEADITVKAEDSCNKSDSIEFNVNVVNSAPRIAVSDKSVSCTQNLTKLIDLFDYSFDEDESFLAYEIISQSNPYFANCYLEGTHFLSCSLVSCGTGFSSITVRARDIFGLTADSTFKLNVANDAPVWSNISSVCLSESKSKFIDLRNFASDTEDKNNLTFALSQSSLDGLSCSLVDSNFISCTLSTNKKLTNTIDLNAIDSKGKIAKTRMYVSSNCSDSNRGSISFSADTYGICLEKCSTYSTPIVIKNDSNERKCFDFESKSFPRNYLDTFVSPSKFCLNKGEESEMTLSANSCGAEERKYDVSVFDNDSNLSLAFKFEVGSCNNFDGFKIEEYDGTICKGERKDFSVLVKNTSSVRKKIYLSAENEMILPHFDKEYITLDGGKTEYVSLTVNALSLRAGETEVVSISADSDSYHIQKELYFDVVDCSDLKESTFSLSVPNVCFDVKRGQLLESQFTISRDSTESNCSTDKKEFFLSIPGVESELSYNTVSLREGDSKTIVYSLIVPKDLPAGKNYVSINAANGSEWDSFTESKSICLNVLPEGSSNFFVRTQIKDVIWCGSEVFEVEVVNKGDLDESYSLSAVNLPNGVSVTFSEERFTVKKGLGKIIYVSVSTNINSEVMDSQKVQLKLIGSTQLTSTIYFNIKEKTTFDDLQILSATSEIKMNGNSSALFDLMIRNNSEKDLNNIILSIESLPEGVNFDPITIGVLKAGQSMKVEGSIDANDINGDFSPLFVVSNPQFVNKRGFSLHVEKNSGVFAGMFMGLFTFGANGESIGFGEIFGVIFLVMILIVLVWLITLGVLFISKPRRKEVWMN
jgi:uncharacterized membrane protein